jgi:hypothetical protein
MICHNCAPDHLAIVKLYNEIVRERPWTKDMTIDVLFRNLWETVKKRGKQ